MKSILLAQMTHTHPIIYLVIFVAMMIEGDAIIFTSFFLVFSGILDFPITLTVVFLGALIGDTLWYHTGLTSQPRNKISLWLLKISSKLTSRFDAHPKERTFHSIFLSKFTYGLHHLLLLRAGITHVNFKKLIKIDILATTVWIALIGGLGYASGASFDLIKHKLEYFEIGVLFAVLIFIVIGEIVSRILRKMI
jgi:membrane-associated protein